MNTSPPPLPAPPVNPAPRRRRGRLILFITLAALVLCLGGYFVVRSIFDSGITGGPDKMFGDQHLKTAVALIELHRVRFGSYPESLKDLKFAGQWDQIALGSVSYHTNADRSAYYVEVERGWMGKPDLQMPEEFWRGTGYSASLKPEAE